MSTIANEQWRSAAHDPTAKTTNASAKCDSYPTDLLIHPRANDHSGRKLDSVGKCNARNTADCDIDGIDSTGDDPLSGVPNPWWW